MNLHLNFLSLSRVPMKKKGATRNWDSHVNNDITERWVKFYE